MPRLVLWKNQEIDRMRRDMDRLVSRIWDDFRMPLQPGVVKGVPSINISETETDVIIQAEIPGVDPEDLDVSLIENIMTIRGETREAQVRESENVHTMERRYGKFSRTLQLPCKVLIDDIKATYKKGILTISMPKCKPEAAREVKIRIGR